MAIQRHLHGKKERSGTQPFMFHYIKFSTLFDRSAYAADGRQQNARARRAFDTSAPQITKLYFNFGESISMTSGSCTSRSKRVLPNKPMYK